MSEKLLVTPTLLVGCQSLFCEGLAALLARTPYRVSQALGEVDETTGPASTPANPVLFIVVDQSLADATREMVQKIRQLDAGSRIAVLLARFDYSMTMGLIQGGADGIILQSATRQGMLRSLDVIMQKQLVLPSEFRSQIQSNLVPPRSDTSGNGPAITFPRIVEEPSPETCGRAPLTDREIRVLGGLSSGDNNKTIARQLDITEATVKIHVKAIFRKIGVSNRTQAALWASKFVPHGPSEMTLRKSTGLRAVHDSTLLHNTSGQKISQ